MLTFRSASLKSLRKENSSPNWKTRQKKSARCWTILTLWQKRVKSYKIQYPSVYNSKTFSRNIVREERPLLNLLLLKIRDWVHFGKCYAVWLNVWAEKIAGKWVQKSQKCHLENFAPAQLSPPLIESFRNCTIVPGVVGQNTNANTDSELVDRQIWRHWKKPFLWRCKRPTSPRSLCALVIPVPPFLFNQ